MALPSFGPSPYQNLGLTTCPKNGGNFQEARMHVHASASKGEGKFWIEPDIELAMNAGLTKRDVANILEIIREKRNEIVDSWKKHFKA
jgi:hypothetical protein